ncbi:MAG: hypothetical protein AAB314_00470, partial [Nitrospirota bacterium]
MRMTYIDSSRSHLIGFFSGLIVVASVLGAFGIPLVSSEGMTIRSYVVRGDLPTAADDVAWQLVSPITIPLSGQVITRPVWPEPTVRALTVRSVH